MTSLTQKEQAEVRFRKLFVTTIVVLITVLFLRMIAPFLQALLLAVVLTGTLYPIYARLRARLPNEAFAAATTAVLVLIAVIVPLLFLVGTFSREAIRLTEVLAPWIEETANGDALPPQLPEWLPFREQLQPYRDPLYARVGETISQVGSFLVASLSKITQGTVVFVLNLFIMLYALFFFLLAGPRLLRVFDYTPLTQKDRDVIVEKGISITRATLKGTVVVGAVQGLLAGAAFAVVGISTPVFWGAVMALASVVPLFGTALVWVPAVVYLLFQGEVVAGLGLLVWCATVVGGADNILRPRLVGSDTQMPDVLILLSTLGGIAMFGATGVIIGPVVAGLFLTSWHIFAATFRRELGPSARTAKKNEAALAKQLHDAEAL
ncbi:MAG TPA: AI-2E family transporter [Gammaproteobacteria bacterium]|nr:AI-2E family transporter [Gammaproteobacteria bacterium]